MQKQEITEKVQAIVIDILGVDQALPEQSFTHDLGADSLDGVVLIIEFEKEFGIQIDDEEADDIGSIEQAVNYIETLLK